MKGSSSSSSSASGRWSAQALLWQLPVACFVIAALTGFLYRLGLLGADLWGLSLQNIRHAHSHLMFFCWAVPLPMYFIIRRLSRARPPNEPNMLMSRMALVSLLLGLASYPFFLRYGYRPVPLGGMELPLSVMLSGLVMLGWYGFIAGYWKERKYLQETPDLLFFDGALLMLFISSLGAWGVAAVQFSGIQNPLAGKALTHFFLSSFTEGWVVMVLLGILFQWVPAGSLRDRSFSVPAVLILFGAPLTFPYGIAADLLSPMLETAARAGGGMAAVGLLWLLWLFVRAEPVGRALWYVPAALLGLKGAMQLTASVLPSSFWLSDHGLRIFYLHVLLLGAFTLGLIGRLHEGSGLGRGYYYITAGSVLGVLVSLVAATRWWPAAWVGSWIFYMMAALALLPALAVMLHGIKLQMNFASLYDDRHTG